MALPFDPIAEAGRNWDRHGFENAEAMMAATSITRAHQILLQRINDALSPYEISFSRFEVLALLYFATDNELPMGKIGTRLQVHPTSVTSLVRRLVDRQLVTRRTDEGDRRLTLIALTSSGVDLVQRAAATLASISYGVDGLSADDYASLFHSIRTLRMGNQDWFERPE